jgi:predicted nucleotidyltransferase
MKISHDFKEFIECANAREVRFLIVGGYAVAFHGYPRYTKDLDVWIDRTEENVELLLATLDDFGFAEVGLQAADFLAPDQVIQLGNPPLRIDLLTSVSGVTFAECYPGRDVVVIEGVDVPFIGLDDLKTNKRASGRHQDLADLENID